MYTAYCHTNKINGKKYVGITKKKPERRWQNGTGYKSSPHFYNAIKKYGWHNFLHEILYTDLTKKEAEEKEVALIKEWNTTDRCYGYNCESGGNANKNLSRETRCKQSESAKRRISRDGAPMQGRAWSAEHREKMKIACSHRAKPVIMFALNDEFLKIFNSVSDAARAVEGDKTLIIKCCKGSANSAYGFKWRYYVR